MRARNLLQQVRRGEAAAQQGLTLIEMLIAMVLGMLIITGMLMIFVGSKTSYRLNDAMSRLQENGRIATEILTSEGRMTAYLGCRRGGFLATRLSVLPNLAFPDDIRTAVIRELAVRQDNNLTEPGFYLLRGSTFATLTADQLAANTVMSVDGYLNDAKAGDQAVVTNCNTLDAFDIAAVSSDTITPAAALSVRYGTSSTVVAGLRWDRYYVNQATNQLFRNNVPLVDDVVDMVVQYGIGGAATGSFGPATDYLDADDTDLDNENIRSRIVALRIELLLRSPGQYVLDEVQTPIQFNGETYPIDANDRRLYKPFTAVVSLRNRVQ